MIRSSRHFIRTFPSTTKQTFDLCVVVISFVVDLVCMQIMPRYKIQDFVFILAFLLPWRVIRVVNSLVVAVQDHEHFRLKLIYGRKKKIVNSLRESEIKLQLFRAQCNALKRLCFNEGVDEAKIDQILMVEECVVNKAGKSKCKIKIDNSSVILLNDKSDFPRLSPRPSLLNLVEKVGRRKSMQPQSLSSIDRELFVNAKDSPKKGILKMRARSNSESGPGTLSSPEEGPCYLNSFSDVGGVGGLTTPIVVNRKSSLSSPMMAGHVRHILNSLEDKVNQMNGSCSRLGGGRGSIDADSIAEEEDDRNAAAAAAAAAKRWSRRVRSIDESTESHTDWDAQAASYASKRRASLQPQKCVDEDDADIAGERTLIVPTLKIHPSGSDSQSTGFSSTGDEAIAVINVSTGTQSTVRTHNFIPTTIQIDPPSTTSNYSLSSSSSNNSSKRNSAADPNAEADDKNTNRSSLSNGVCLSQSPNHSGPVTTLTLVNEHHDTLSHTNQDGPVTLQEETPPINTDEKNPSVSLKRKTLRTPSDIENQNNMTLSESSDVCESQSYDADTRNTSIEELEDEFENCGTLMTISTTDQSVLSGTSHSYLQSSSQPGNGPDCANGTTQGIHSKPATSLADRQSTVSRTRRSSLTSKDGSVSSIATDSSVDPPEFKSTSQSHLLS